VNLLALAGLAATALGALWTSQSLVLLWIGEPLAWPLRFKTQQPAARRAAKILIPSVWVLTVVLAPLCLGSTFCRYYGPMLAPSPWRPLFFSVIFILVGFALLHAVGRATGYIRPFREHPSAILRGKLLRRIFVIPIPAALIEELVFRCLVLKQLLIAFPATGSGTLVALFCSSAIFSAVHFVAPKPPGEPVWQAASGLFFVGCAIGAGYIRGGQTLWLPLAIHASGIACVEAPRLLTRFDRRGRWLVGTREFPTSGLFGIAAMSLLTAYLLIR
jgi:Type II CAAX prenyl endopeptidase Rce1-like